MLEPGLRLGGRYLLLQRLGAGGMGEVWLAQQEGSGTFRRRVVIKCVPPERRRDPRLENMLHDEARILGLLHHPGIVAPIDYIEDEAGPLLVLEHVDGPSLRTALRLARRNNALMSEPLAAWIGAEVARALHAAHGALDEQGRPLALVHRDVSPDNVLLSRDGRVRLADFGVARALGNTDVTNPGAAPKGKRGYMAPEQAAFGRVGPAADQFALGRVIAEAADINCGPALRAVLDRATAEKQEQRYESALALAEALAAACPPPSDPPGQLAIWLQRAAFEALEPPGTQTNGASRTPPPVRRPFLLNLEPGSHEAATVVAERPAEPSGSSASRPGGTGRERPSSSPSNPSRARTPPPALPSDAFRSAHDSPRFGGDDRFAGITERRSRTLRLVASMGALCALALPIAWLLGEGRVRALLPSLPGLHAPTGDLDIQSRPDGAEVYVDGTLKGITPLAVRLPAGRHALRVGSLRLEKWRAADVDVRAGAERRIEIDLSQ